MADLSREEMRRLARLGATVTGLDRSPEMVEQARAAYPQIEFLVGDAAAFGFEEPFDAVFSNATLHWVRRPAEVAASTPAVESSTARASCGATPRQSTTAR